MWSLCCIHERGAGPIPFWARRCSARTKGSRSLPPEWADYQASTWGTINLNNTMQRMRRLRRAMGRRTVWRSASARTKGSRSLPPEWADYHQASTWGTSNLNSTMQRMRRLRRAMGRRTVSRCACTRRGRGCSTLPALWCRLRLACEMR